MDAVSGMTRKGLTVLRGICKKGGSAEIILISGFAFLAFLIQAKGAAGGSCSHGSRNPTHRGYAVEVPSRYHDFELSILLEDSYFATQKSDDDSRPQTDDVQACSRRHYCGGTVQLSGRLSHESR
jgi:hypothetical protein